MKVITLPRNATATTPLVVALRDELTLVLQAAASCPHLCCYLGVTMKGGEFLIVMQLYKESLKDYIIRQPGVWDGEFDLTWCSTYHVCIV